jgi:hypothetical protein
VVVHEASARFQDQPPRFGDPEDRQAVVTLRLYRQAVAAATRRLKVPDHLQKKLEELEQADLETLKSYIDPHWRKRRRRPHGW